MISNIVFNRKFVSYFKNYNECPDSKKINNETMQKIF